MEKSRIKFNPVTKEIEIEGNEQFVKKYFSIIQTMMTESRALKGAAPEKAAGLQRRGSKTVKVLGLIQSTKDGITTTDLKKKTGLADRQIWAIIYKAEREGKIRKAGRGVYAPK